MTEGQFLNMFTFHPAVTYHTIADTLNGYKNTIAVTWGTSVVKKQDGDNSRWPYAIPVDKFFVSLMLRSKDQPQNVQLPTQKKHNISAKIFPEPERNAFTRLCTVQREFEC